MDETDDRLPKVTIRKQLEGEIIASWVRERDHVEVFLRRDGVMWFKDKESQWFSISHKKWLLITVEKIAKEMGFRRTIKRTWG